MPRSAAHPRLNVDPFVEAYESARERTGRAHVADHLPPGTHPDYMIVLAELVRVDIECRWADARPRPLSQYLAEFPDLRHDRALLRDVAFEDFRQRLEHGERPSAAEYATRYNIDTSDWIEAEPDDIEAQDARQLMATQVVETPLAEPSPSVVTPPPRGGLDPSSIAKLDDMADVARLYQRCHIGAEHADSLDGHCGPANLPPEAARVFANLQASNPGVAARYAKAVNSLPLVGDTFAGFRLVDILGHGTFGCVYLARDVELADRTVALKVAVDLSGEPQTLARLQHTNIMPVYSYHKVGAMQVVCMPYFGSVTLANVIGDLGRQKTIPGSGQHFVSTLNQRAHRPSSRPPSKLPDSVASESLESSAPTFEHGVTRECLTRLTNYSYVDAVLWLGGRIADGLGHAHDRGIIHRDLKPANILLTDEGQPMLLDFNLASNEHTVSAARIGGTLPYMAPEHLAAFNGEKKSVDARSDVYALGLLLFELLAGRHPFPSRTGPRAEIVPEMIRARLAGAPRLRPFNAAVSPATEAIVLKCLEADPGRRYPTARALQEDLDRQLSHQPLRYAAEPSTRERVRKFRRRHPKLASNGSVIAAALAVILALAGIGYGEWRKNVRNEAIASVERFKDHAAENSVALGIGMLARDTLPQAIAHGRETLDLYGVLRDPAWMTRSAVTRLPEAKQKELRRDVADLLYLTAQGTSLEIGRKPEEARAAALDLCRLAIATVPADERPASYEALEARLVDDSATNTAIPPAATAREKLLVAMELFSRKQFPEALALAEDAIAADASFLAARFLKGTCLLRLGRHSQAEAAFDACTARAPEFHWAFYMRGLARESLGRHRDAERDFTQAIASRGDIPIFYISRAKANLDRGNELGSVVEDLTTAMKLGAPQSRLYLYRADALRRLGRPREAEIDFRNGLKLPPADARDFEERGFARMEQDPKSALEDFEEALKLNPEMKRSREQKELILSRKIVADGRRGLGSE